MSNQNRVTGLGPIDVQSKYFKPPEPPIVVGDGPDEGRGFVEITCPACQSDLAPPLSVMPATAALPTSAVVQVVQLRRENYSYGAERADGSSFRRDAAAYVGQCERCQRIYIATVR
jgi:hypothetical protein